VIEKISQPLLSALAVLSKILSTLLRGFSGFLPPRKPCPFRPEGINSGRDLSALLSFLTSQASPSVGAGLWGVSTHKLPFHASFPVHLTAPGAARLTVFLPRQLGSLPFQGAGLSGLSDLGRFAYLFGRFTRSGLFFHLRGPSLSYDPKAAPLCCR